MVLGYPQIPGSLSFALRNRMVIPFVGAGISRSVRRKLDDLGNTSPMFPSWVEFTEVLAIALDKADKGDVGASVRSLISDHPPKYLEAMQVAFDEIGPTVWFRLLDQFFDHKKDEAEDSSLEIARLVWLLGSNLIITTNIDKVLQWACPKSAEFRLLDAQKKEFGKLHKKDDRCPTVVYLHGHIDNSADIVFTQDQYSRFYGHKDNDAKLETLKTLLTRQTFLFLGFSLDDPYLLQQLSYIHTIYDGGADSLFVVLHKNERDT